LPVGICDGFTGEAAGKDGQDGVSFAGVDAKLDGVLGRDLRSDGKDGEKTGGERESRGPPRDLVRSTAFAASRPSPG
jgi:hypothetical protein